MKTRKIWLGVFLLLAAPLASLSLGQKPYPLVTEVRDGVKTVLNPDFPRDGRWTAKLIEEMSCGEEGGPPEGVLNKPFRLGVDGQGNVYVSDYGDSNIKVYDGRGRFLRAIGRQGQGPGEFGGMVFFDLMAGGQLCVLDFSQSRVSIMDAEGAYVSGFPLKGFFGSMEVDGRDRIFLARREAVKEPESLSSDFQEVPYVTSVHRTDVSGKDLVHLLDFLGESMNLKGAGGGAVIMSGGLYTIVWAVSPEGKIYGGYNLDYSIGVFGEAGRKEFVFGREFTPAKNPRFKGQVGQRKALPAYNRIILDEEGNIWVELIQAEMAKGFLYDVFSSDGIYSRQVSLEQRVEAFRIGRIYSIVRPEEGYPSVKRYKMELGPAGK